MINTISIFILRSSQIHLNLSGTHHRKLDDKRQAYYNKVPNTPLPHKFIDKGTCVLRCHQRIVLRLRHPQTHVGTVDRLCRGRSHG